MGIGTKTLATLGMVGGGIGAIGDIIGGYEEGAALDYNAKIADQEAHLQRVAGELDTERMRRYGERTVGRQRAMYAKAGVKLEGSPLDVIQDTMADIEFDIMIRKFNASVAASRAESEAEQLRSSASSSRRRGYFRAGKTILQTAALSGSRFLGGTSGKDDFIIAPDYMTA